MKHHDAAGCQDRLIRNWGAEVIEQRLQLSASVDVPVVDRIGGRVGQVIRRIGGSGDVRSASELMRCAALRGLANSPFGKTV